MAARGEKYYFQPDHGRKLKKNHGTLWTVLLLIAVIIASALAVNYAGNLRIGLETENVRIMALNKDYEGFRILHISDLSGSALGSDAQKWTKLLSGAKWNAVVMTGDMVGPTGNDEPLVSLIHTLRSLKPDVPIYFIAGDGDPEPVPTGIQATGEVYAEWVRNAAAEGAVYLDAPTAMEYGKHKIWFSPAYLYDIDIQKTADSLHNQLARQEAQGVQYELEGGASYRVLKYRLDTMERSLAALQEMTADDMQIAVNHIPLEGDYIRTTLSGADLDQVFNFRAVDLILCGHLCAGDYRLPGESRAIYVDGRGFFPEDDGIRGMTRVTAANMYISPGLSSSSTAPVKLRLFNKPAVTILRFTGTIE